MLLRSYLMVERVLTENCQQKQNCDLQEVSHDGDLSVVSQLLVSNLL